MSQFEDLTKIKVKQAIASGVEAQRIQRIRSEADQGQPYPRRPGPASRITRLLKNLLAARKPAGERGREKTATRSV